MRPVRPLSLLGGLTRLAPLVVLLLLSGAPAAVAQARPLWADGARDAHITGRFHNRTLTESSGVVVSRRLPGVLWTLDDSGNPPWLFATDTTGRDLGVVRVAGARNRDWEALAAAPCGAATSVDDCLYLADTGDNFERRSSATIYRIPEPALPSDGRPGSTAIARALTVRYPGGSRNVEALFVDAGGDMYLVSKGGLSDVRLFRVPGDAWRSGSITAEDLGALPIERGDDHDGLVTDAALAPDGRRVAIRTYRDLYLFERTSDGRLRPGPHATRCHLGGLEAQGEGIAWLDPRTFVLTSEGTLGAPGTVAIAHCAEPAVGHSRTD